jgi:surface carbohydrate biosynthesis protein
MLKKLRDIYLILYKIRFSFTKPRSNHVALVHRDGVDLLESFIAIEQISIIDPYELNIWVAAHSLLRAKFTFTGYTTSYVQMIKPKIVMTFIDNDPSFYLLKSLNPTPKYIAIQNGTRNNYSYEYQSGFFDELAEIGKSKDLKADLVCTFGSASIVQFKKYIRTSCLVIGSLRNNLANIDEVGESENFDVVFISQLPAFDFSHSEQRMFLNDCSVTLPEFYEIEAQVSRFLADYCLKHSLNFAVLGKRGSELAHEYKFFSDAIGNLPFTFVPKTQEFSSYSNSNKSKVVIVIDSTIGYELLSRGMRVGFFSARNIGEGNIHKTNRDNCFGYPNTYPDRGSFWTNFQDPIDYERIIKYLFTISDAEWSKEIEQYTEALMAYRPTNGEFIHMLEKEGIPVRSEVLHRA